MNLTQPDLDARRLVNGWDESGERLVLVKALTYETQKLSVTVPVGFVTDMASVPRLLWWLFPPFGRYLTAAVVHDYLYQHGSTQGYTRAQADWLFLQIMVEDGVALWRAWMMYRAVRWFGWRAWQGK